MIRCRGSLKGTIVKKVTKGLSAAAVLVILATAGLMAWPALDSYRAHRALAAHLQSGKAYAARALDQIGTLPAELPESSGLAVSRTQPGVLWSHNDSGDRPTLYAIDSSGKLLATLPVSNAAAQDWEDIATGPCPASLASRTAQTCLYLADTGNNGRPRDVFAVYVVVEPKLAPASSKPPSVVARSFRYRYPDRPQDAEAIVVQADGNLTIVSKGRAGTIDFYAISSDSVAHALTSDEVLTAEYKGNTGIRPDARIGRLVTGAALSPDGATLAVRTYSEVFFYGATVGGKDGIRWRDLGRPCFLGNAEPQGEGIDYLDPDTLVLSSERALGRAGPIHRLRC